MNHSNNYAIILAGGAGKRLWPLSRQNNPKQLLPFGKTHQSLLEITIKRVSKLIPKKNIVIVTTQNQLLNIQNKVGHYTDHILIEPCSRNTAPAILFACKTIYQNNPHAIIAALAADHYIGSTAAFTRALEKMYLFAQKNNAIALMGSQPTHPMPSYGHIQFNKKSVIQSFYSIEKFHEKPHKNIAATYCKKENMLWNMGIFCAQVQIFLQEYKKYAPTMESLISEYMDSKKENIYATLPNISIDYAIMEKSDCTYVLPTSFTWSDVGNLTTFLSLSHTSQCIDVVSIDAQNNVIHAPNKIVGVIGVKNMCIVETEDALLIVNQSETEKVKHLLEKIEKKHKKYL